MRPSLSGRALAALILAALTLPAAAQSGFPWWKDEKVVRELGLTPDQSTRIDSAFRATFNQQRQSKEELDRQEAELSRLIESNADETDLEDVYNTERYLLYVACTRARVYQLVTGVDPASELLVDLA